MLNAIILIGENMKKKKGFTLIELIAVIIIIAVISLVAFMAVTKTIKNNETKKIDIFNDSLISAAEVYITNEKEKFTNFKEIGDVTMITTTEMVEDGYLDKSIDNPTKKDLVDFYVRATINNDKTISYEVVG